MEDYSLQADKLKEEYSIFINHKKEYTSEETKIILEDINKRIGKLLREWTSKGLNQNKK